MLIHHPPHQTSDRKNILDNICKLCCATVISASVLVAPNAQAEPFTPLRDALNRVVVGGTLAGLAGYDYLPNNKSSLFGVWLTQGQSQSLIHSVNRGETYMIIGGGDEDIVDLDIEVTTASGVVLAKDNEADPTPVVQFTAPRSEKVTIKIKNYRSTQSGFCAMVILQDTGTPTDSLSELSEALDVETVISKC